MRKVLFWVVALVLIALGFLWYVGGQRAKSAEINGGSETGSYTKTFAPLIQGVLAQSKFRYPIETSAGSVEACQRVVDDPTDVSLAQLDVAMACITANPGKILLVRTLADECLFGVTGDPQLANLGRVEQLANRLVFATAAELSGSTATFKSVMTLDPEGFPRLAKQANKLKFFDNADLAVQAVADGDKDGDGFPDVDVAFFVAYADTEAKVFQIANGGKLSFIPIANPAMRDLKYGDQPLYGIKEIEVTPGGFLRGATSVKTACTKTVILTGDPAQFPSDSIDFEDQSDLVQALTTAPADAYTPKDSKWTRIFGAIKEVIGKAADDIWDMTQN